MIRLLLVLFFSVSCFADDFGDIPTNLEIPAGQCVRRSLDDTNFEAFTCGSGGGSGSADEVTNSASTVSLLANSNDFSIRTPSLTMDRSIDFIDADGKVALCENTLTEGAVPFINSSGVLTQNSSKLYWDSLTDSLGVGTDLPLTDLHLNITSTGWNPANSTDGSFLITNSLTTYGDGVHGAALMLSGPLRKWGQAGIAAVQIGNDPDKIGLDILGRSSPSATDAVKTMLRFDPNGIIALGDTSVGQNIPDNTLRSEFHVFHRMSYQEKVAGGAVPVMRLGLQEYGSGATAVKGQGPMIAFYIPKAPKRAYVGAGIAGVKDSNLSLDVSGALAGYVSGDDENLFEAWRTSSTGDFGIGTDSPTKKLDVNSDALRLRTPKTPTSATDTCDQGEVSWDVDYVYVCIATNTWKRNGLSTW